MIASIRKPWARCVDFHGHECPGLAIGFRAALEGLRRCGEIRAADEEIVAVVENDACGVDAVQVLTGCTLGKGNLIHLDHGKQVFTFFERLSGRSVRLSLRAGAIALDDRQRALIEKERQGLATQRETEELLELRGKSTRSVIAYPFEHLFSASEPRLALPGKAVVQRSELCLRCGEPTMPGKMVEDQGERVCRPCAIARTS